MRALPLPIAGSKIGKSGQLFLTAPLRGGRFWVYVNRQAWVTTWSTASQSRQAKRDALCVEANESLAMAL